MKLEDIQKVIGTPEENREILIKALLLDLKMKCSDCGKKFFTVEDMKEMYVHPFVKDPSPAFLDCHLECGGCTHQGIYTFRPNPLMPPSVKATYENFKKIADEESSSGNYALEA